MKRCDETQGRGRLPGFIGASRVLVLVGVVMGMCWFDCVPALGLSARGHEFVFSFGGPDSGAGGLSDPSGVAVDEATGDVYVVDRGNERVERFGPEGRFLAAWGWGVRDGAKEFEVCESTCEAGLAGAGKGQLSSPGAIAVDNSQSSGDPSKGDVYVVADSRAEHGRLSVYSSEGEPLRALRQGGVEAKWEGVLDGVAVDGQGRVSVYRGDEGFGTVERFGDSLKGAFEEPALESSVGCAEPGFAVDSGGERVYVAHERENRDEGCPAGEGEAARPTVAGELVDTGEVLETVIAALDPLATSAIGVEAATGQVYVVNGGSVSVFSAAGALVQRLELPGLAPDGTGVAVNASTGQVYVADAAADTVDVFAPEPPAAPAVSGLAAQDLSSTSAQLSARVDPRGADTRYYFQYGTSSCASVQDPCTDVPAAPGVDVGSGFADVPVAVELEGLSPSTTYYFSLLAVNEHGQAEGSETFGSLATLPSAQGLLADGRAWEMVSPVEKDGSGIEPLRKEGGLIQASEDGNAIAYVANGPVVAEPEGNRAPYPTQAIATRSPSGWSSQQIVTPRVKGEGFIPGEAPEYRFFSADLSQALVQPDNQAPGEPLEQPPLAPGASEKTMYVRSTATGEYLPLVTPEGDTAGTRFGGELEFVDATTDLSHAVLASQVPLISGAGAGLYEWRAGAPLEPVSVLPDGTPALEPSLGQEDHNVRGAISADGGRVIWSGESEVVSGEGSETVRHLYMSDTATGQTLQLDAATSGITEPGEEEAEIGFQGANSQGTRVFFTDTARLTESSSLAPIPGVAGNPADLYECEVLEEHGKLACDLSDLTAEQSPLEDADVLNLAPAVSENGSYVYFVANGVLAPGAKPGDCVHSDEEAPSDEATCNLYLWHEGATQFVATLSNEDSGDWGSTEGAGHRGESVEPRPDLAGVTAGSSPDGNYFAFMSREPLTGYDNRDANPAAKGTRDEEVYLYDAASKRLTCASCNPDGEQPHGVFDTQDSGEGLGLLVDRPQDWVDSPESKSPTDHWLAGSLPGWTPLGNESAAQALRRPRYLSNTGRLFFDGADPLIPVERPQTRQESINGQTSQVGVENVYEYEPSGEGSCQDAHGCVSLISSGTSQQESAFLDASSNGDDAFFLSAQPLVAQDRDTNFDLYDARVCTEVSPCLTSEGAASTPCESTTACRLAQPPAVSVAPSGTSSFTGPGNTPREGDRPSNTATAKTKTLTRAQKLAKALKSCRARWKHSPRKRASCERRAHKAYPATKARNSARETARLRSARKK